MYWDAVSALVNLLGQSARVIDAEGFLGINVEAFRQKRHDFRVLIALQRFFQNIRTYWRVNHCVTFIGLFEY